MMGITVAAGRCSAQARAICLYHPSRSQMPRKLRVFIDFIQPRIAASVPPIAAGPALGHQP
jgi:DNA-binding transcriptional LysR family regulator